MMHRRFRRIVGLDVEHFVRRIPCPTIRQRDPTRGEESFAFVRGKEILSRFTVHRVRMIAPGAQWGETPI